MNTTNGFVIRRGTNISHWLSQSQRRGAERAAWFTAADVQRLKAWGFDHIRLPVDEVQLWDESGAPQRETFQLLDAALDWCANAGLRVIVDLHIVRSHYFMDKDNPPLFTNPREAAKFIELWLELSHRLHGRDTRQVAYELLNEPVARDPRDWNRVSRAAYSALREAEPDRVLVLGANWFNVPENFDKLWLPDDDRCVLTFHFYKPMLVTHYQASWTDTPLYTGRIQYPGKVALDPVPAALAKYDEVYDRAAMVRDISQPLAIRQATGHPLFCGEFGCLDTAPDAVRRAWYRDFIGVLTEHDIAWANWDYKGRFGIVTTDGRETSIADVVLGR